MRWCSYCTYTKSHIDLKQIAENVKWQTLFTYFLVWCFWAHAKLSMRTNNETKQWIEKKYKINEKTWEDFQLQSVKCEEPSTEGDKNVSKWKTYPYQNSEMRSAQCCAFIVTRTYFFTPNIKTTKWNCHRHAAQEKFLISWNNKRTLKQKKIEYLLFSGILTFYNTFTYTLCCQFKQQIFNYHKFFLQLLRIFLPLLCWYLVCLW